MDAAYRKLLTYSYNILGSFEDARGVVQDVMEKHIPLDKTRIENEVHYLTRMVINHSINDICTDCWWIRNLLRPRNKLCAT